MRLNGEFVYLTSITYNDTDDIVRWRNKDSVRRFFIYREEFTAESHKRWLEDTVMTGKAIQFIIREKKTNLKIGSVYLKDIDKKNRKCEFGIFIGEEEKTGIGYGREAALLATNYAFKQLGINKVYLRVLSENLRAYKSYLSSGFKKEGVFEQDVWIEGKAYDIIFMAKFATKEYKKS